MLRAERLSPRRYMAEQERLLRGLIQHSVEQVPFYRELYSGVDVASIRNVADLAQLPVVDKPGLRAAGSRWRALNPPAHLVSVNTSGSSGAPFRFEIDPLYDQWRKAQYLRPYLSNGRGLRERVLRLRVRSRMASKRPWFSRFGLLSECWLDLNTTPEEVRRHWQALRPAILQGYPSALRPLAQACVEQRQPLLPPPRLVFTDSELLLPEARKLMEESFGAPVIDVFGTFETDNIAYQCERREGYHLTPDSVIVEVLRDGVPVAAGETGELVVTVLRNRTTPFIRYNLHDLGALATEPCACGRSTPVLKVIAGRANDLIVLPDGRRQSPLDIIGVFSPLAHLLRQYQVRQTAIDRFEVWLVPTAHFTAADLDHLSRRLAELLGHAHLDIHMTERIASDPSGKLRAFVSEVPKGTNAQ
jgi:phenylacetate-CoA ligase